MRVQTDPEEARSRTGSNAARRHVLVVEDSAGIREYLTSLLTNAGYEVTTATDASEAIDRLKREYPTVLITDLNLSWGNGLAIGAFVKWLSFDNRGIPVILLSAQPADEWQPQARAEGVFACFTKPFDPDALVRAISDALRTANGRP